MVSAAAPLAHRVAALKRIVRETDPVLAYGRIAQVVGLIVELAGPIARIGDCCLIEAGDGTMIPAEVVGFREGRTLTMPLRAVTGLGPGHTALVTGKPFMVPTGKRLLGRVVDALGAPMDGRGPLQAEEMRPLAGEPPNPMRRARIVRPLATGVRALDGLLTVGEGQRLGIFAGSGIGKSTLLGMIARNSAADVNVIALVGERGREVLDFIEGDLGDGLARSVVVVATSDQPPPMRAKAPFVATVIAEAFRDQGLRVMLMMDSITRFCMAQREIGLAVGEPPTTRGYTPSVFAMLPQLLERAGTAERGSITALYTVLVEGDDMLEPVADHTRSILDGHIVLSRALAALGHYPPIEPLESVSRLMSTVAEAPHRDAASALRAHLATYREAEDLINLGAYHRGSNPRIDAAIARIDAIRSFLRQAPHESAQFDDTVARLTAAASA